MTIVNYDSLFGRPAGVGNQRLAEILDASASKNSVTYTSSPRATDKWPPTWW